MTPLISADSRSCCGDAHAALEAIERDGGFVHWLLAFVPCTNDPQAAEQRLLVVGRMARAALAKRGRRRSGASEVDRLRAQLVVIQGECALHRHADKDNGTAMFELWDARRRKVLDRLVRHEVALRALAVPYPQAG